MTEEQSTYGLHPKEAELLALIRSLKYGIIRELKIHDGLPEIADVEAVKRVKFKGENKNV